jgi:hypothetical protein
MNQREFQRLRDRYLKAVWKRINRRGDLYVQIEQASKPKIALNAAKKYYRECVNFNRELERFISRLEKSI